MKRLLRSTKTITDRHTKISLTLPLLEKEVAYITYKPDRGQIGTIYVKPIIRGQGIGTLLVETANLDIYNAGNSYFWAVTNITHPFWKNNVFGGNRMIWKDPVHNSVSSGGYIGKIPTDEEIFEQWKMDPCRAATREIAKCVVGTQKVLSNAS